MMMIKRWKPFQETPSLQDRINGYFGNRLDNWSQNQENLMAWDPSTDVYEDKDEYRFRVELPGVKKEDVEIEMNNQVLVIKGEKKESQEIKKEQYHRIETVSGTFYRSFRLPQNVDSQKIKASLKDGILDVRVPKQEEAKPKSIPIQIG
jgi:HSP20 family protein